MVSQAEIIAYWHDWRLLVFVGIVVWFVVRVVSRGSRARDEGKKEDLVITRITTPKVKTETEKGLATTSPTQDFAAPVKSLSITNTPVSSRPGRQAPRRITGVRKGAAAGDTGTNGEGRAQVPIQPVVFFSSLTGSTETYAKEVVKSLERDSENASATSFLTPHLHDLSYIEYDDFFLLTPKNTSSPATKYFYILLVPTYNIDTTLDTFLDHLKETHHDFRIDTAPLSDVAGFGVFGFGDREGWPTEEEGFCTQAREVDKWMARLTGGKRAYPLGMGDVKSDAVEQMSEWTSGLKDVLHTLGKGEGLGEGVPGSGDAVESADEDELESANDDGAAAIPTKTKKSRKLRSTPNVDDLEDLGRKVPKSAEDEIETSSSIAIDFTTYTAAKTPSAPSAPKPMVPVTSPTYTSLTKQGYAIIGTHSGVKICRWTKSALRGRGSCYKRSFYGIASHLCMETTPSLSCSNKCVFCWRHGTNPVGTTWRWQVDPPELIFNGAKEAHLKKIKMMRGVPGVRAERFQEAMRIRHCALSLVGEPIFYPHINEFMAMLHAERISSFLVCNAQHPDQLAALKYVTQLYVSIDASNRESLRRVDRPLHRDFWERFLRCLDILRARRHRTRTVFRLTLVKGFNVENEAEGYAELVARGRPCFVEVKGVTYCGTSSSTAAGLTMQNVPFWHEVAAFVRALDAALARRGLGYGIAAEHQHSCCVLLASESFRIDGKWHTLIDYDKFFELLESGEEFGPEDYVGEATPEWAAWGQGGFDPADQRVDRKGRVIEV